MAIKIGVGKLDIDLQRFVAHMKQDGSGWVSRTCTYCILRHLL